MTVSARGRIRWRSTLAFVALVVVAAVGQWLYQRRTNDTIQTAQVASCKRGNTLRRELNARLADSRRTQAVVVKILAADVAATSSPRLRMKARRLQSVETAVPSKPFPMIDCNAAVHHPSTVAEL